MHRRTIQRDLLELAEVFPIVADERAKPYGWRWSDDADLAITPPFGHALGSQGARIDVSLRVRRDVVGEVLERLGAWDHRITDDPEEAFVIAEVAVSDSLATRRLLLGHADEVEVVAPVPLRRELVLRAQRILALHLAR